MSWAATVPALGLPLEVGSFSGKLLLDVRGLGELAAALQLGDLCSLLFPGCR